MKIVYLFFLSTCLISCFKVFSCQNIGIKTTSIKVDSIKKPFSSGHFLKDTLYRLDSLQGTWVSNEDSTWKIKFTRTQLISIHDNQVEEDDFYQFYLADTCAESIQTIQPVLNTSGEMIIEYQKANEFVICFTIIDLTTDHFSYLYANSKYHSFTRCENFDTQ
jgi:hypothetical protein